MARCQPASAGHGQMASHCAIYGRSVWLARKLLTWAHMHTLVSVTGCDEPPVIPGGKYRLDALLGEGGMGEVWRAFNLQLEVPVAIKVLRSDLSSAELGERLRVEARAAAKLMHPGIVRVFDAGEARPGEPYIVMELLSGESLGDVIDRGPVAAVEAVKLLLPVVEALGVAHARGVVHRDLKPDNIFIAQEGGATQPKLLDFGIAKLTGDARHDGPKLTQIGTLLGSPDYMSPEQARGLQDIDHRSDIWALCVVLYEALSGQAPFLADNYPAQLRCIIEDAPAPLSAIDPKLAALVLRGLEKARERRYGSCQELGEALAAWLLTQGVEHDVTGAAIGPKWLGRAQHAPRAQREPQSQRIAPPRARRWMPKAAAVLLALGAAGLGGKLLASPTTAPAPAPISAIVASAAPIAAPASEIIQPAPALEAAPTPKPAKPRPRMKPSVTAPAPISAPSPKHDLIDPYR